MVSKTKSKIKKKGKLAKASKKSSTKKVGTKKVGTKKVGTKKVGTKKVGTKKKTRVTAARTKKVSRRPKKTTAATPHTLSKEIEASSAVENMPSSLGETTVAYETQSLAPDTLQDEATTVSTTGVQDEEYNPEDTSISGGLE
jgi:hypothetical protein